MFFSSLKNKTIYTSNGMKIGKVKAVNIDYDTGKIYELVISSVFGFKTKTISIKNIIINDNIFYSKNPEETINEPNKKGDIININVYTESREYLGKVSDFNINNYLWRISQIIVHKQFIPKKTITIADNQIISISSEKIIVKDLAIKNAILNPA